MPTQLLCQVGVIEPRVSAAPQLHHLGSHLLTHFVNRRSSSVPMSQGTRTLLSVCSRSLRTCLWLTPRSSDASPTPAAFQRLFITCNRSVPSGSTSTWASGSLTSAPLPHASLTKHEHTCYSLRRSNNVPLALSLSKGLSGTAVSGRRGGVQTRLGPRQLEGRRGVSHTVASVAHSVTNVSPSCNSL